MTSHSEGAPASTPIGCISGRSNESARCDRGRSRTPLMVAGSPRKRISDARRVGHSALALAGKAVGLRKRGRAELRFNWQDHPILISLVSAGTGITMTIGFLGFLYETVWQTEYVSRRALEKDGLAICARAECRTRAESTECASDPEERQAPKPPPSPTPTTTVRPPGIRPSKPRIPNCNQRTDAAVCEWEGLIWQRKPHKVSTWNAAVSSCKTLVLDGSDDWFLPDKDMAGTLASPKPSTDGCYVLQGLPWHVPAGSGHS
jgi:hypothetical protein